MSNWLRLLACAFLMCGLLVDNQSVDARTGHLAVRYDPAKTHTFDARTGARLTE